MFIPSIIWSIERIASRSPPIEAPHRRYENVTPISRIKTKSKTSVKRLRIFSLRDRVPNISTLQYHVFFPTNGKRTAHHAIQNVPWKPSTMRCKNLTSCVTYQTGLKEKCDEC